MAALNGIQENGSFSLHRSLVLVPLEIESKILYTGWVFANWNEQGRGNAVTSQRRLIGIASMVPWVGLPCKVSSSLKSDSKT
jgi:hypothetical protein